MFDWKSRAWALVTALGAGFRGAARRGTLAEAVPDDGPIDHREVTPDSTATEHSAESARLIMLNRGSAPNPGSVARGAPISPLRSFAGAPCAPDRYVAA
jgi:hypothetical protein